MGVIVILPRVGNNQDISLQLERFANDLIKQINDDLFHIVLPTVKKTLSAPANSAHWQMKKLVEGKEPCLIKNSY